jgi:hypothetical protein
MVFYERQGTGERQVAYSIIARTRRAGQRRSLPLSENPHVGCRVEVLVTYHASTGAAPDSRITAGVLAEAILVTVIPDTPQIPPQWLVHASPSHSAYFWPQAMGNIDGAEVAKHNSKKSCWIVLDSKAYDVTSFLGEHPGGAPIILRNAGTVRHQLCQDYTRAY